MMTRAPLDGVLPEASSPTVGTVLRDVVRRPGHYLIARWNWKAALLSAIFRGALFFAANLSAGLDAAGAAFVLESGYRSGTSGSFAALTQAFRRAAPPWAAALVVSAIVPAVALILEFGVHWLGGTPELTRSMTVSAAFTAVSAAFTLFAMRRGVFIVGDADRQSFRRDLVAFPGLIALFVAFVVAGLWRGVWRLFARPFRLMPDREAGA